MKAAVKAGETLGLDPDELYPSLRDRTKRFVFVDRKADPVKAKALQQMGVAGFGFYPEERRAYPQAEVASHVLGFAGTDNQGLDGLERTLDKTLAGGRATRSSCATPPATRSTSSRRARSGPDGTSSSRSTTSSRRARSSSSPTPSAAGGRRARRRS